MPDWEEVVQGARRLAGSGLQRGAEESPSLLRRTGSALGTASSAIGRVGKRSFFPAAAGYALDAPLNDPQSRDYMRQHFGAPGNMFADIGEAKNQLGPLGRYGFTMMGAAAPNLAHYGARFGTIEEAGKQIPRPGRLGALARGAGRWGEPAIQVAGAMGTPLLFTSGEMKGRADLQNDTVQNMFQAAHDPNSPIHPEALSLIQRAAPGYTSAWAQENARHEGRIGDYLQQAKAMGAGGLGVHAPSDVPNQPPTSDAPATTPANPNAEAPGLFSSIPNWGRALGIGGGALLGGSLLNRLTRSRSDDDADREGSYMPGLGTLAGLGGVGLGLGAMTNWDYRRLMDPNWWSKTGSARPLSIYKHAAPIVLPNTPGFLAPGVGQQVVNTPATSASSLLRTTGNALGSVPGVGSYLSKPLESASGNLPGFLSNAAEGAAGAARRTGWRLGGQVHLDPSDVGHLSFPEQSQLASDPRQQSYVQSRPLAAPDMGEAKPSAPIQGLGLNKGAPPNAAQPAGRAGPTTPPGAAHPAANSAQAAATEPLAQRVLTTHFNGDPNAAQQAAWKNLQSQAQHIAPPEVQQQGPQGIMQWISSIWNSMDLKQKILLGAGLGLGAIGLMGMMRGGEGGGGMGMMGPLLGLGGLGLAGYMGYQGYNKVQAQNTAGDASGGLADAQRILANPRTSASPLSSQDVTGLVQRANDNPNLIPGLRLEFARHDPATQASVRQMFANNPTAQNTLNRLYSQGSQLRSDLLSPQGQQAAPPAGQPPGQPPPAGNPALDQEAARLAADPATAQFFQNGQPNTNAIGQFALTHSDQLPGLINKLSPAMRQQIAQSAAITPAEQESWDPMTAVRVQAKKNILQALQQSPAPGGAGPANPNQPAAGQAAGRMNILTDPNSVDQMVHQIMSTGAPPGMIGSMVRDYMGDQDYAALVKRIPELQSQVTDPSVLSQDYKAGLGKLQRAMEEARAQHYFGQLQSPEGLNTFWKSPASTRDMVLQNARYMLGESNELPGLNENLRQMYEAGGGQGDIPPEALPKLQDRYREVLADRFHVTPDPGQMANMRKLLSQAGTYETLANQGQNYSDWLDTARAAKTDPRTLQILEAAQNQYKQHVPQDVYSLSPEQAQEALNQYGVNRTWSRWKR